MVRKKYPEIIHTDETVDKTTKKEIGKNVKAMVTAYVGNEIYDEKSNTKKAIVNKKTTVKNNKKKSKKK